ncbi:hypothetical protein M7I_5195 [Glarea lozoyensis 74030]|uniref:Uncharacterized protein n=1 Tax=Glarea lozoyensis (strain ATCC 74030 / MF5533) TaxID=1104152 RepID=H0ER77_GLAL7|nr:hypothetical protein M7I_5195 [Glarea lozoyensis 74030]
MDPWRHVLIRNIPLHFHPILLLFPTFMPWIVDSHPILSEGSSRQQTVKGYLGSSKRLVAAQSWRILTSQSLF